MKSTMDVETLYYQHINLLHNTVWYFIRLKNLSIAEYEELFSQANLFFMVAYQSYDGKSAKFSTWLRIQVLGRMTKEYSINKWEWEKIFYSRMAQKMERNSVQPIDWLDELSIDAKVLVSFVREGQLDLDKFLYQKTSGIKYVFHFLRKQGWSRVRISRCFRNLKRLLEYGVTK